MKLTFDIEKSSLEALIQDALKGFSKEELAQLLQKAWDLAVEGQKGTKAKKQATKPVEVETTTETPEQVTIETAQPAAIATPKPAVPTALTARTEKLKEIQELYKKLLELVGDRTLIINATKPILQGIKLSQASEEQIAAVEGALKKLDERYAV